VPYNQFLGTIDETLRALAEVPKEHITIVFPHWGNEYQPATPSQKYLAHMFADAGADAVIGAHPHVIQEHEIVNGIPIYYSLGNFIFDQYWSDEVRTGMGVVLHVTEQGIASVEEKKFMLMKDGRTCPKESLSE
jgi:poly-gamma-glutamate capsule biosynthesis protein CapA/YwtB (metallophosphatase superfamily)